MSTRSLFLAWQDKTTSRKWFPVGLLDADVENSNYRFRYTGGAKRAQQEVGFPPIWDFPDMQKDYRAPYLFPIFQNRVMSPRRPDFTEYLTGLDLPESANPIEILSVDGGHRVTDNFEVFPRIEKHADGSFRCRFFLHGWRYMPQSAQQRIDKLITDDELHVTLELTNPATRLAVQIQTQDYHVIGWAPHYLRHDLVSAMAEAPGKYDAHVVRLNPLPRPSRQRLLIELNGRWVDHKPMSDSDFEPLVDSN